MFLVETSKKNFDVDDYYKKFQYYFIERMSEDLEDDFIFSKYLFLRFSLEEISREMTISNLLFHLFYCPRSIFSESNCLSCSRLFLKKELEIRFDFFETFNLFSYLESDNEIQEFIFSIFWNNEQQKNVIQSDISRCLNSFVVQYYKQFLLLILEIHFRVLCNFFYCLSKTFSNERNERISFLKISFKYIEKFTLYILYNINFIELKKLFEEIEFDQFKYLKVINKKYKEELRKKYED